MSATHAKTKKRAMPVPKTAGQTTVPVRQLREQFGLNRKLFSRLVGYSERAVAKWEAGEAPAGPSKQRLTEIQRLQQALGRIMKASYVGPWLQASNEAFGGLKPLEVIERGQIDRLWRMIYEVESGMPT
jgi:DNA-binding transcriptional regulator YiaG